MLIVDDDGAFRGLAARMLAGSGLDVVAQVADARSAVAAAQALRPDCALVDVHLRDGDGIALGGELAALPWSPRVVLTSSDPEVARLERPGPGGRALPFVTKENLPNAALRELLGGGA